MSITGRYDEKEKQEREDLMNQTVLVTGGTGFIGSHLIKALSDRGKKVYALIRKDSLNRLCRFRGKDIQFLDIETVFSTDFDMGSLPVFDVCFHLAAYGVDRAQIDLRRAIEGNLIYAAKLLEFCQRNKTEKIINTGSCFEYGESSVDRLSETEPLRPSSLYGILKAANTQLCHQQAKERGLPLLTIRPFGVFGEAEGYHKLVPQIMQALICRQVLPMTAGEQIRDYLYVGDLINAYMTLAEEELPLDEVYNVCSSRPLSIRSFAETACRINGGDLDLLKFGELAYRGQEARFLVGDNSKIKRYSSWRPSEDLDEALRLTYEWYRNDIEIRKEEMQ